MEPLGALPDAGEAAGNDFDVESLVFERVLGRPDKRADGGSGRELQVEKFYRVVLRHGETFAYNCATKVPDNEQIRRPKVQRGPNFRVF